MADELEIEGVSLSHLFAIAMNATLQAGDLLKRGFYSDFKIKTKSDVHDLVTDYDKIAEEAIIKVLHAEFPTHSFLCEESGKEGDLKNKPCWIIDPIDGTWNFARQIPSFATSIALAYKGKVYVAICNDPMANELFTAMKGAGALMNGKPLHVSKVKDFQASGVSFRRVPHDHLPEMGVIRRSGSTVLDMCYVAKGALEALIDYNLQPWDFAAAALIVEEAGGKVSNLDGTKPSLIHPSPAFIAANPAMHRKLIHERK